MRPKQGWGLQLRLALVFTGALGHSAGATPSNSCEASREAEAQGAGSDALRAHCAKFLKDQSELLDTETKRLRGHVKAGTPLQVVAPAGAAGIGVPPLKPARGNNAKTPKLPKTLEGSTPTLAPAVASQSSPDSVVTLAALEQMIDRAATLLRERRLACQKGAVCAEVVAAERSLLVASGLVMELTYVPCKKAEPCLDDEDRAALLDRVRAALSRGAIATEFRKARALGLTDDVMLDLLALAERSEKELTELGHALDAAGSNHQAPEDIVARAKRAIERARTGAVTLSQALEELPKEERTRVALLLQRLSNPGARHVPEPRLMLAVVRSKHEEAYDAETNFLSAIKEVLVATTDMATRREKVVSREGVAKELQECQEEKLQVCDGVLEIAYSMDGGKLTATGRIHFPVPPGGKAPQTIGETVDVPATTPTTGTQCSNGADQGAAAYKLLRRLSSRYAVLSELAFLGYSRARPVLVGRVCGSGDARVFEVPVENATPALSRGFVFENGGCAKDFAVGLRSRLGRLAFFRDLTEQDDKTSGEPTLASGAPVTAKGTELQEVEAAYLKSNCEVSLREDKEKPPYYAVRTYWQANDFEAGVLAGDKLAEIVTGHHLSRDERPAKPSSPPPVRPSPPRQTTSGWKANRGNAFWALASPGLPWLSDDVDSWNAVGVGASVVDVALLIGAVASYGRATELRYEASDEPSNTTIHDESQRARNRGNTLLISAGALRLLAGIVYLASPPTDRARRSLGNALARPLTWTF